MSQILGVKLISPERAYSFKELDYAKFKESEKEIDLKSLAISNYYCKKIKSFH